MNRSADNQNSSLLERNSGSQEFAAPACLPATRAAQANWLSVTLPARLKIVRRFRQLLAAQADQLTNSANPEGRRPVSEPLAAEILPLAEAARFLEREAAAILDPRKVGVRGRPLWLAGVKSDIHREPFGLVLVMAPSNYPAFLPGVQVLQALVAGNAVWFKPGVGGTSAAIEFARLLHDAGLPENLLRVLPEATEAAQSALAAGVDKVFFTGSARVGAQILSQIALRAIPATMELSGCDAVIVRVDADLDLAVRALAFGLRLNSGKTCIAPRRVLVARSVATEFEGRLARAMTGLETAPFSPEQRQRLAPLSLDALANGAHLLAGEVVDGGQVTGPLVLAGVARDSRLLQEDFFGPLLLVLTVSDDEEAIRLANDNPYALGASIFTRDEAAALALARRIEAGIVLINDLIAPTADARLPFGGRKLSGFGVTRGREGLLAMTTQKVVTVNRSRQRRHFAPPQARDAQIFRAYLQLTHGGWKQRLAGLVQLLRAFRKQI